MKQSKKKTPLNKRTPPEVIGPDSDPPLEVRSRWAENITERYFDDPVTDAEILAAWHAYKATLAEGRGHEVRHYLAMFFTSWDGKDKAMAREWLDTADREALADEVQRIRTGTVLPTLDEVGTHPGLQNKAPASAQLGKGSVKRIIPTTEA